MIEIEDQQVHEEAHLFDRLARWVADNSRLVLLVWVLLIAVMAPLAVTLQSGLSGAGWDASGSESEQVRDELQANFPEVGAEAATVIVHQENPFESDPAALEQVVVAMESAPDSTILANPLQAPAEAGLIS